MAEEPSDPPHRIAHLTVTSATLAGVCLTIIGIIRYTEVSRAVATRIDDILAVDTLIFVTSAVAGYLALRAPHRIGSLERAADLLFLIAMIGFVGCGLLLTYALGVI